MAKTPSDVCEYAFGIRQGDFRVTTLGFRDDGNEDYLLSNVYSLDALEKLQYDLFYIKRRSLFLDISIVFKTLSTIIFFRGQ